MGLVKRPLYKAQRKPARKKGVLHAQAPVGCPDAHPKEIAMALAAICIQGGIKIGQGGEYNSLRDEYTLVGKSPEGKAQDFIIEGVAVAALIEQLRVWNGGRFERDQLTKAVGGMVG